MLWSSEKIIQKIYCAVDQQQYRQIESVLRKLNGDEVFSILYTVLTNPDRSTTRFSDQDFAGKLLLSLNPSCSIPPKEAIRELLHDYNLSIEEIPWYFARQYGKAKVLEILEDLDAEITCDQVRRSLKTWQWWLRAWKDRS
jgi:hypothetical protein